MVLNDVDCVLKVLVEICVQGRLEEARKFTITILIVTNYSLLLFIFFFYFHHYTGSSPKEHNQTHHLVGVRVFLSSVHLCPGR